MGGALRSRAAGRLGAPPRLSGALRASLILSAPALILAVMPEWATWLQYDRTAVAAGQIWRAITCHWTHWSPDHLLWDVAAFAVLVWIGWRSSSRRVLSTLALSAVLIPLAVWSVLPTMAAYRGLSGIDSALFVLVAATLYGEERAAGRRGTALLIALVVAGFAGKIAFELVTGAALFVDSSGFVPVPLAHLVGGICGGWVGLRSAPEHDEQHGEDRGHGELAETDRFRFEADGRVLRAP